jgi:Right handed beta helix region
MAVADCPPLPPATGPVVNVRPADAGRLPDIVSAAPAGATIRLADGTYRVSAPLVFRRPGVTLRSASGNAARVVLDGRRQVGAIVHPFADRVRIAEVTLTRARDHLVHAYPQPGGPDVRGVRLYRLHLRDSGEQFVKVNGNEARSHWVHEGFVSCSRFTMTRTGRANIERGFGCYTGGIDVHGGRGWRVRDNRFAGIYCEDGEVAEHAVHFWSGSRGTVVERNEIVDCARGIGFGLGEDNAGHEGGVIRNNRIVADIPQYDTGIGLEQARGARVLDNTVVETRRATKAFASIDLRFPRTDALLRGNRVRRIVVRDGARRR